MALVKQATTGAPVETTGLREENFELDLSSTDVLISLLANMYARPAFSSLREVLQNAKDSGTDRIDVRLPTELSPELEVRDFGRGMNEEDMRLLLKRVGASSKRGDVAMAGQLGIGSISPMSIADAMTIRSYKNGEMTTLVAWKSDSGDIRLSITPGVDSSEPTGTKVTVPVHPELFRQLEDGLEVFRFSPEMCKLIRVESQPLEPLAVSFSASVKVGEHDVKFSVVGGTTDVLPGALVLMNGIPMGASLERFPDLKEFSAFLASREASMGRGYSTGKSTLVIDIPPAAGLSFPPSREVLAVTRLNAAFLSNACMRFLASGEEVLDEQGLHLGCEAAVLGAWRKLEMDLAADPKAKKGINYSRVAAETLEKKLNKTSESLRLKLGFTYWMGREIPVVQMTLKLPEEVQARTLETNSGYDRKGKIRWRMSTSGCTPFDYDHPEQGFQYPFPLTSAVVLVTWSDLDKEGKDGWVGAVSRNDRVRQALFQLRHTRLPHVDDRFGNGASVLLLSASLPEDHPLRTAPNASFVELSEELEDFAPWSNNPFVPEEEEEEEESEKGTKERRRHPRVRITAQGGTEVVGLPKDTPFTYVKTWRGNLHWDYNHLVERYRGPAEMISGLLAWFERAGIADSREVVCLTPSEVEGIKREHVEVIAVLEELMKEFLAGLTREERQWLPFMLFREMLAMRGPTLLVLLEGRLKQYQQSQTKPPPGLDILSRILLPPPSDKMDRVRGAWKKALSSGPGQSDYLFARQWLPWIDCRATLKELREEKSRLVLGVSRLELATPALALRRWLVSGSLDAKLFRLFWSNQQTELGMRNLDWTTGGASLASAGAMLEITKALP